jgi:hypothetical protein
VLKGAYICRSRLEEMPAIHLWVTPRADACALGRIHLWVTPRGDACACRAEAVEQVQRATWCVSRG